MTSVITRRKQVRDATFKLLTENGLEGWKVRFNPKLTRALGRCISSRKTIEYQPRYMEQNDFEQVLTTIKHEVAHAIAGHGHGHDATWARIARNLGLENPRAVNSTAVLQKKFSGKCINGHTTEADRRSRSACGRCCNLLNHGLFSREYMFIWTRNN